MAIEHSLAVDLHYFRSTSRWTPELEKELIILHNQNNAPNIFTFGLNEDPGHTKLRIQKENSRYFYGN